MKFSNRQEKSMTNILNFGNGTEADLATANVANTFLLLLAGICWVIFSLFNKIIGFKG